MTLAGTDPELYRDAGATWVLITGWLDELRDLAVRPTRHVGRVGRFRRDQLPPRAAAPTAASC